MSTSGPSPGPAGNPAGAHRLQPAEFAVCFQDAARVLWTIAAGVLGDPTEVEDVLQEAAVMALGKLEQFTPGTSFAAWMGCFVRNVALNRVRKAQRRSTQAVAPGDIEELAARRPRLADGEFDRPPIDGRGVLHEEQTQFDDRVLAGLRELGPDQRASLLLRAVLELSFREISEVLGIPEGTAMSHVHRARVFLRTRLGKGARDGEREGDAIAAVPGRSSG